MAKVFISYRRTDSAAISGRIYDRLVEKFKRKNVFKDVDDIPAGVNFGDYIQESVRECAVMLVVIGQDWLDIRGPDGGRRLDDLADWVRIEIEMALSLGLTIIPLLVEGATMPQAPNLPVSLREVVQINALKVRNDPDFTHDVERVIAAIEYAIAARPEPGIFRHGISSRLAPSQPQQHTSGTPPVSLPAVSATPTTATLKPATSIGSSAPRRFDVSTHEKPPALPKQPPSGGVRARRIVMTAVAAIVIVASFGVLLSKNLPGLGANAIATQTTSVRKVATTTPARLPLTVAAPGPGCDQGWSRFSWQWIDYQQGSVSCSNNSTHLDSNSCQSDGCMGIATFSFSLFGLAIPLLSSYTISVQISNLSKTGGMVFGVDEDPRTHGNKFDLTVRTGGYSIDAYCNASPCPQLHATKSGLLGSSLIHTLAFHFDRNMITAELDATVIGSYTETAPPVLLYVRFGTYGYDLNGSGQVDFSNFQIR